MSRFISRVFMISVFFIGLGAVADTLFNTVKQSINETKIKVIKFDKSDSTKTPEGERKVIILQRVNNNDEL